MDATSIDSVLVSGLWVAAGLLASSVLALAWLGPGRRALARRREARSLGSALDAARTQRDEAKSALARASRELAALRDAAREDSARAIEGQRADILAAFAPLAAELSALVGHAPRDGAVEDGVRLVARQLAEVLERHRPASLPPASDNPPTKDPLDNAAAQ